MLHSPCTNANPLSIIQHPLGRHICTPDYLSNKSTIFLQFITSDVTPYESALGRTILIGPIEGPEIGPLKPLILNHPDPVVSNAPRSQVAL